MDLDGKFRSIEINVLGSADDFSRGGINGQDSRVVYFGNWNGAGDTSGQVLNLDGERIGYPLIKLAQQNQYRVNWGEIMGVFASNNQYLTPPVDRTQAKTTAVYIAVETHNISDRNSIVSDLRVSSFRIYGLDASPSPSPSAPINQGTGQITANPNPCIIPAGQVLCSSAISWSTTNTKDPVQVKIRETGGLFASAPSGTSIAPWISGTPLYFDLYEDDGRHLLSSVQVQGVVPSASITAVPNPCTIASGQMFCSSNIAWTSQNAPDLKIKIKDGALFAQAPAGNATAPWISTQGVTFEAYSGSSLLASLEVRGSGSSPSPSPSVFAKPGDIDNDGDVDIFDYNLILTDFGKSNDVNTTADLDNDNDVDIFDYNLVLTNFGK